MRITQNTRLKEVTKFLISEFGLYIHGIVKRLPPGTDFVIQRSAVKGNGPPENIEFEVSGSTTVYEFQEYFSSIAGLNIELRNSRSIKIPENSLLESGKDTKRSVLSDSQNIDSSIHAALSVATDSSYYSDVDWVYKILKTAARQANDNEKKSKLIEALCKIAECNTNFSANLVKSILDLFCRNDSDYIKTANIFSQSNNQDIKSLADEILEEHAPGE